MQRMQNGRGISKACLRMWRNKKKVKIVEYEKVFRENVKLEGEIAKYFMENMKIINKMKQIFKNVWVT